MAIVLKNNRSVTFQLLRSTDADRLFHYFSSSLSIESKSRYGPHPFDKVSVDGICAGLPGDTTRYIAIDDHNSIVAYMLIKKGMIESDRTRLLMKNIYYNKNTVCTFAPSVADAWQNTGLGSLLFDHIEKDILKPASYTHIILWGGVQATNSRAVHFYEKKGFQHLGTFWHEGKENYDMMKELEIKRSHTL